MVKVGTLYSLRLEHRHTSGGRVVGGFIFLMALKEDHEECCLGGLMTLVLES